MTLRQSDGREGSAMTLREKADARIPACAARTDSESYDDAHSRGPVEASPPVDLVTEATTPLDIYAAAYRLFELYHVPRSQVWQASRGRQCGKVHLHVANGPTRFTAANGRTISRGGGVALCLRSGWYEREVEANDDYERCPRCADLAKRYAVPWQEPSAGAPERDS